MSNLSPISYELFDFLADLQINNNRPWFAEHKHRYTEQVLEPCVQLCEQLSKPLRKVAAQISVEAKPYRGSIMRIYRDTRFSKDKRPYKTNVGISLRHRVESDLHSPGIYLHLEPRTCFMGFGCWKPDRETLSLIRQEIINRPASWNRIKKLFQQNAEFEIAGDQLKQGPRGVPKDHPCIEDLKRTDFILLASLTEQELVEKDPIPRLVDLTKQAGSWMRFLCRSIQIKY